MTTNVERMLPLYEAKMIHHFDHRWATYEAGDTRSPTEDEMLNPGFQPMPRYWMRDEVVMERLAGRWSKDWLVGYRWVSNATNERTFITAPHAIASVGNSEPIILSPEAPLLSVVMSSFAFDFVARQKLGGQNVTFSLTEQLPIPPRENFDTHLPWIGSSFRNWMDQRAAELNYVTHALRPLYEAESGPNSPFHWNPPRRALLRVELDAAFFHLYGIARDDVDYIMDTFPIVKRKDEATYGEYRTKRLILEVFDAMQRAINTGTEYQTILDPPPGEGPRHPPKESNE